MPTITIVPAAALTREERAAILTRYTNRDTKESPWNSIARLLLGISEENIPTDQEWIDSMFWQRLPDGSIRMAE